MKKLSFQKFIAICAFSIVFTGCYSVFSGGTGGLVVDAESTSTPKSGIANVDVYAYMSQDDRDTDFSNWTEGTKFTPKAEYYGHTTTGSDGSFSISKLVWKEQSPDFGKDADYTSVYLLFYHENYGLTKGETVLISDSTSDTVYAELTATRKSTVLSLNFVDVATDSAATEPIYVKVTVPQTTAANTTIAAKVYDATITGNGDISISYPRWQSEENRTAGKETEPTVTITYVQSADIITWAGCYNGDNSDANYAFRSDAATGISKVIKNPSYSLTFYGKTTKLSMPTVGGQYSSDGSASGLAADDGVTVSMKRKDSSGAYTIDCGQVTTASQTIGTSSSEKHGNFSGLGSGCYWNDTTYTQKFSTVDVELYVNGTSKKQMTLRSDSTNVNVQLN